MRIVFAALAASALAAPVAAQTPAPHPDFAGVWVMDTTRFHNTDTVLVALTLTVTRRADTLVVQTDGADRRNGATSTFSSRAVYSLAGSPTQNAMTGTAVTLTSRLSWDGPTLVLTSSAESRGRSYQTVERWTPGDEGKTMSRQATFQMGGMDRSQTLVFSRK